MSLRSDDRCCAQPPLPPQPHPVSLFASGPLRSDAIGLKPGAVLRTGAHPTRSVSLHEGRTFEPQHAARASGRMPSNGGLDIDAMVRAKLAMTGNAASTETRFFRGAKDTLKTVGTKTAKFGKWMRDERVAKKTGMFQFDYTLFGQAYTLAGNMITKSLPVIYEENPISEPEAKYPCALLATIDKTYNTKKQMFVVTDEDKLAPFKSKSKLGKLGGRGDPVNLQKYHLDMPVLEGFRQTELRDIRQPTATWPLIDIASAQEEAYQMEKVKVTASGKLQYNTVDKVHPLLFGFSMVEPLDPANVGSELHDQLNKYLKHAQDLREQSEEVESGVNKPWIVGIPASYKENASFNKGVGEEGNEETRGTGATTKMHPITALLITPLSGLIESGTATTSFQYKKRVEYDTLGYTQHSEVANALKDLAKQKSYIDAKPDKQEEKRNQLLSENPFLKVWNMPPEGTAVQWKNGKVHELFSCAIHAITLPSTLLDENNANAPLQIGTHPILVPKGEEASVDLTKYCMKVGDTYQPALGHAAEGKLIDMRLLWTTMKLGRSVQNLANHGAVVPKMLRAQCAPLFGEKVVQSLVAVGEGLDDDEALHALMAQELQLGAPIACCRMDSDDEAEEAGHEVPVAIL